MAISNLLYAGTGVLFIALSIPLIMGRVKPNHWYGFRFAVTLNNPRIWYPANRLGGILLLLYGLAVLGMVLGLMLLNSIFYLQISEQVFSYCLVCILISGAVLISILSWRYAWQLEKKLHQNGAN